MTTTLTQREKINNVLYYFICSNGKPVANLIASTDENMVIPSFTFDTDAALKLSNFLNDNSGFTLVHDNNQLLILPSEDKLIITSDISIDNNQNNMNQDIQIASYPSYYLLNVPYVPQGSNGLCWAGSVASLGKYKTGITKTAKQVADAMGVSYNEGANIYLASAALDQLYGISNYAADGYIYSIDSIADQLLDNKPIVAGFGSSNLKLGHMVVICGYQASTQGAVLIIRDPNYSSTKMISSGVDTSGDYTWIISYYSGQGNLYWYGSVFLN